MNATYRCCTRPRVVRTARWLLAPGLLLALAPKCPLCLAAYLSIFGAGAAAAMAPWVRPASILLICVIVIASGWIWYREYRRVSAPSRDRH